MKNIYYVVGLSFLSIVTFAQELQVSLSQNTACVGESVTVDVAGPELELATPASVANNNSGVMFDIVASESVTITGFTANPINSGTDFEVYYRVGSFVGHETSSTGWILLGSSTNIPAGLGNIGVSFARPIIAGQTLGFYVTSTTAGNYIYYDNGTSVGTTLASDGFLTIEEGVGKSYPFGSTNTTRNFVGSVLYEPKVQSLSWNVSSDTVSSSSFTAQRTVAVTATGMVGGLVRTGYEILEVTDIDVDVQASPVSIQSGQSSTLSSTIMASTGLASTFDGGNNQDGAMFDVVGITDADITGFSIYAVTGGVDLEVFYKTGTHVGFEGSASAWTSLGTFSNVDSAASAYVALPSPVSIVSGQTLAFYITRTDGGYLYYSNGTAVGNVVSSDAVLQIEEGKGVEYPFGNTYTPRILNTIIHYDVENPSGATYSWSPNGGSSGSANVSPASTTEYTLTAGVSGCSGDGSVTVIVDGITDLEEETLKSIEVYPNPAYDIVNITWAEEAEVDAVSLYDLQGKLLYRSDLSSTQASLQIPVDNVSKGLCLLQVKTGEKTVSYKVQIK